MDAALDAMDFVGAEAKAHHRQVMGKWRRLALQATTSHSFWLTMKLFYPVLEVFQNFRCFLQSHDKLVQQRGVGALAVLVHSKADEFMDEFDKLLDSRDVFFSIAEV